MLMDECQHYVKEICAHIPVRYSPGAGAFTPNEQEVRSRIGCGIMPP